MAYRTGMDRTSQRLRVTSACRGMSALVDNLASFAVRKADLAMGRRNALIANPA